MSARAAPTRLAPAGLGVFAAGAATFALELLGPRRVAPLVGTSLPSMTASVAVVLFGAAIGAAVGGRLADRGASRRTEGLALLVAALWVTAGTWLSRPAVAALPAGSPLLVRALVGAVAMLFGPSVALGAVPILAARRVLAERPGTEGLLGRLAAIGAFGGLVGLFGVAALLARVGVTSALGGISIALAATGLSLLARGSAAPGRPGAASRAGAVPAVAPPPRGLGSLSLAAALLGFAILSLEIVAVRRVAARVGSSLEAWTAVLAVVLLGLTIGSARAGDGRAPGARAALPTLFVGGAVLLGLLDDFLLNATLELPGLGPTPRVLLAILLAYGPAFVGLGTLGPRLSRAAADGAPDAGRRLARVSILGTAGALVGTLATAPWLLPLLRSEGALALASIAAVAALALPGRGLPHEGRRGPLVAFALRATPAFAVLGLALAAPSALRSGPPTGGDPSPFQVVFDRDGPYARVVVAEVTGHDGPSDRVSRLSIDARIHGVVTPHAPTPPRSPYVGLVAAVVDRAVADAPSPTLIVLGGGAYAVPRAFLAAHPDGRCDVIELDPTVNEAARAHLGLGEDDRLRLVEGDAREALSSDRRVAREADVIFVDAFGDVSIPWTLTTVEFAREAKSRLRTGGTLVVNAIDAFVPGRLVGALYATLRRVFARVEVVGSSRDDDRLQNFVFVASDVERDATGLVRSTPTGPVPLVRYAPREWDELVHRLEARPLTDDFAPVEDLVGEVVARTMGR